MAITMTSLAGKPAALTDVDDIDWIPTQHMRYTAKRKKQALEVADTHKKFKQDDSAEICV